MGNIAVVGRIAGLASALALEGIRMWADSERNRPSLHIIQRDAQNFSTFINTGTWLVEVRNERTSDEGVTVRTDRFG